MSGAWGLAQLVGTLVGTKRLAEVGSLQYSHSKVMSLWGTTGFWGKSKAKAEARWA